MTVVVNSDTYVEVNFSKEGADASGCKVGVEHKVVIVVLITEVSVM